MKCGGCQLELIEQTKQKGEGMKCEVEIQVKNERGSMCSIQISVAKWMVRDIKICGYLLSFYLQ